MPSESVTFIAVLLASAFLQLCQGMRWGGVELSMPPLGSKANSCEVTSLFTLPSTLLGLNYLIGIWSGSQFCPIESSHHERLDFYQISQDNLRNRVAGVRASGLPLRVDRHVLACAWPEGPRPLRKMESNSCSVQFPSHSPPFLSSEMLFKILLGSRLIHNMLVFFK